MTRKRRLDLRDVLRDKVERFELGPTMRAEPKLPPLCRPDDGVTLQRQ